MNLPKSPPPKAGVLFKYKEYISAKLYFLLEGEPGASVISVDNSAIFKTEFIYQTQHRGVVSMRVYADIAALFKTPAQTKRGRSAPSFPRRHTMDNAVGFIVKPSAVFYLRVSRIWRRAKAKYR